MNRSRRKLVAWLGLGVLLFMQLAVAAYACAAPTLVAIDAPMMAQSSREQCAPTGQHLPKLCEQHCLQDSQSVDTQPHTVLAAPVLPLIAVVSSDTHSRGGRDRQGPWLASAVDPPPLVRFCVLRI